ncbi:hypothetical protein BDW22DRAFT_1439481 [Trametopsis cervina]|nr:hypothetical protein BDW22DRAFT_1439481 [Trametopsis cervina]
MPASSGRLSKHASAKTRKSGRERQPSNKQAMLDAEEAERTQKQLRPPPVPRNIQAAARKITAATVGSITSRSIPSTAPKQRAVSHVANQDPPTLPARRPIVHRHLNLTVDPIQDGSMVTNSQYCNQIVRRREYSPLPQNNDDMEELEYEENEDSALDWRTEDDDSSLPPNSEPTSEDQDEEDDLDDDPTPSRLDDRSPSLDLEARNIEPLRRIVRYHEDRPAVSRNSSDPNQELSHKRTRSGPSTSAALHPKVPKLIQHGGRARCGDYENDVQDIIKTSQGLMKMKLYTVNAFPTPSQQEAWVTEVWTDANTRENVDYQITGDIHKLLLRCATQLHSSVKGAARDVVASAYPFSDSVSKKDKDGNRQLYNLLMNEGTEFPPGWLFKRNELALPPPERTGIYQNSSLSAFTNKIIYNTRSRLAIGIRFPELIGQSLTLAHIAFNLSMIQFALTEWEDGWCRDSTFTEDVGRKFYEAHCMDLARYKQAFGEPQLNQLGNRLVKNGSAQFIRFLFFYFGASYTSSRSRDSSTRSHDLHDHMTYTCTRTRAPHSARTDNDITGPATPHGFRIPPEPWTLPFPDPSDFRSIGL